MADLGLGLLTITEPLRALRKMDPAVSPGGVMLPYGGSTTEWAGMFGGGGTGGACAAIPKRWNPGTSTWDVIPGP